MNNCPKCGKPLPDHARFCFACGALVESKDVDDTLPIGVSVSSLRAGSFVFDDYVVESLVQADEAGERYVAHHRLTGQLVTVLLLASELGRDEEMRRLILSEGRRLARLHHPNIPVMFNLREDKGRFLAVFEHPDGTLLEQLLDRRGAFSPSRVLDLAGQLLSALDEAHRHGLVHGSVSPKWVYVDSRDRLMVTGFGFLQSLQSRRPGLRFETDPRYQAPEQALGQPVDQRTDVYLAGLLLYTMLAGRPPFDGPADYEILKGQVEQPPPDLRALQPTVPPQTALAVGRALVKSPDGRYESAASFLEALRRAGRDSIQDRLVLPVSHQPVQTDKGLPTAPGNANAPDGLEGQRIRRTMAAIPSAMSAQRGAGSPESAVGGADLARAPQAPPLAPGVSPLFQGAGRAVAPELSVQPDESWDKSDDEPVGPGSSALVDHVESAGTLGREGLSGYKEPSHGHGTELPVEGEGEHPVPVSEESAGAKEQDAKGTESGSSTVGSPASTSGFGSFFESAESYDGADDFSDLEDFTGSGRKGGKVWWALGLLVVIGAGAVGAYYWLDPYARVPADKEEDASLGRAAERPPEGSQHKPAARPSGARQPETRVSRLAAEPDARPETGARPPAPDPPEEELAKVRAVWSRSKARAVAPLEAMLRRFPASSELKRMLGMAYEERAWRQLNDGSYRRTISSASKATGLWPQATLAWFCLGYALRQRGKKAEAARAFRQYLERCRGKKCRMLGIARRYAKSD